VVFEATPAHTPRDAASRSEDPPAAPQTPQGSLPSHITSSRFRDCELSLQSSLHLSIALLVRYRSRAGIQPCVGYTTRFELQSQAVLLAGTQRVTLSRADDGAIFTTSQRGCHPPFQYHSRQLRAAVRSHWAPPRPTPCTAADGSRPSQRPLRAGTRSCVAASLAVTGAIAVAFFSSTD